MIPTREQVRETIAAARNPANGDTLDSLLGDSGVGWAADAVLDFLADAELDAEGELREQLTARYEQRMAQALAEAPHEGMSEDDVDFVCAALMEVGGWDEIDGDGDNASIIADHIRRLPRVLADRAEAPQPKVLGILEPLLRYSLPPGGTVLDPFAGACSTLVAAREAGYKAIGIEADEAMCEKAALRLAAAPLDLWSPA